MNGNDTSKTMVFPSLPMSQPDSIHLRTPLPFCCNDLDPLRDEKEERNERKRKGKMKRLIKRYEKSACVTSANSSRTGGDEKE